MMLRPLLSVLLLIRSPIVDSFIPPSHHTARPSSELYNVENFFSNLFGPSDPVTKALTSRRTINNFETTKVSDDVVERAIEAAIYAPNHKMTEPWRFTLLGNETIAAIATLNAAEISKKDPAKGEKKKARWAAIPGWCVVTSTKSDGGLQEKEDYAATCCAVHNFCLSLYEQGVGTKWTTGPITRTKEFADLCGIDQKTEEVVGCIWYGFASNKEPLPAPRRRKSVEDVTRRRA